MPSAVAELAAAGTGARALAVAAAVAVAAPAAADGAYFPTAWGWLALAGATVALWALLLGERIRLGHLAAAQALALWSLVCWIALSTWWSGDRTQSVLESERALVYAATATAALLLVRRRSVPHLLAGVLAGIVAVSAFALSTKLFPSGADAADSLAAARLAEPIGYWNALGALAALGLLLTVGFAARSRSDAGRAFAGGAAVLLAPTLYFTFSRGAWLALAVGAAATLALDPRRLQLAVTSLAVAPAAVAAVWLAAGSDALTERGAPLAEAAADGRRLAPLIVLLIAAGAAAAAGVAAAERRVRVRDSVRFAGGAVLVAAVVASSALALARAGGPAEAASRAYDSFRAPPVRTEAGDDLNARLFNLSSNGRIALWEAAWANYRRHPLLGSGAGSYEQHWQQERTTPLKVRDAHSLYLETLSELGPLGLALLLAALALPLVAAARARAHPLVPAAAGAYAAYVVHAGVDWDWEIVALTLGALLVGVALLAAPRAQRQLELRRAGLLAAVALMAAAAGVATIAVVGNGATAASADAAAAGDTRAAEAHARKATRWAPWSGEAWRLLGEAQLARGNPEGAVSSLRTAVRRDPRDWGAWYALGNAATGLEERRAYARAAALNPLSPSIAVLRRLGLVDGAPANDERRTGRRTEAR